MKLQKSGQTVPIGPSDFGSDLPVGSPRNRASSSDCPTSSRTFRLSPIADTKTDVTWSNQLQIRWNLDHTILIRQGSFSEKNHSKSSRESTGISNLIRAVSNPIWTQELKSKPWANLRQNIGKSHSNLMKLRPQDHLNTRNIFPLGLSQKDQVFIVDFEEDEKARVWTRTHEISKSKVLELMDWLKIEGTWLSSS